MKSPCAKCPFKKGTNLSKILSLDRKAEIWEDSIEGQGTFFCHNTTEDNGEGKRVSTRKSKVCHGALAAEYKAFGGFTNGFVALLAETEIDPEKMKASPEYPACLSEWQSWNEN